MPRFPPAFSSFVGPSEESVFSAKAVAKYLLFSLSRGVQLSVLPIPEEASGVT
jgi:hypothetical protein